MARMMFISRYDKLEPVSSPLDPLENVTAWISGLNSKGYSSDLLRRFHGFKTAKKVKEAAEAISDYTQGALSLLDQAYSGSPETSFLPLYYAILNLSKIEIVLSGRLKDLQTNRWHGATYNPVAKSSHDLMTEQIVIKKKGVFPLYYEVLTGLARARSDTRIRLREIIPYLRGASFEYGHLYGKASPFQSLRIALEGDVPSGFRLRARLGESIHSEAKNLRYIKAITGFRSDPGKDSFHSGLVRAQSEEEALKRLVPLVRRALLYETQFSSALGPQGVLTPLCNKHLLMVEEIPIWLTFFHLSSVVRYKPEFLAKLKDSKAWPLMLAMHKHSVLRFLLLFWAFVHKTEFVITPE